MTPFRLAYFEGGRMLTPIGVPNRDPPSLRYEDFDTRKAAMARARELISNPRVTALSLHGSGDVQILNPEQLAKELGVRLPRARKGEA